MERVYVGLDAGSRTCHVVVMDERGVIIESRKFPTGERNLIEVFEKIKGEVHVHLEAAELAGWIRGVLKGRVEEILISNPQKNAWIANDPQKNDKVDATKLADLLRTGLARKYEVFYPDDEDRAVFKRVVQHYDRMTDQQARQKQLIKARLRTYGVLATGDRVYHPNSREDYLGRIPSQTGRALIEQLYEVLDQLEKAQKKARALMRKESKRYPEIKRFEQVPGVGLVCACRFSAYIQTPHRFRSQRKLFRYCRLGICEPKSDGKSLGRRRLDRSGIGRLKDLSRKAYIAAISRREDNRFKRGYQKSLERTGNATHARLTTQRKILAVLRAMWLGGTDYQDTMG